jgi:tetratricopeptide (TPR) repeat protein
MRAILSLAILYDESGDLARAGSYYELALKSHSSDPQVELAAAAWYASRGNFSTAEKRAQIALSLKPGLDRAKVLLGRIYLQTSRYSDAIAVLRDVVTTNRDNATAWYSLGLAYRKAGDPAKAIASFASALQARPDDEVARIGQEAAAVESLPLDDAQRAKMAAYHFAQGRAFEERSFLEKALAEYRRALILDPTSAAARIGYARIYKSLGFPAKYLSELQVLARLGSKDTSVSDEIDRLTSVLSDSVSRAWGYDQYNIDRARYVISVYTLTAENRLVHALASEDVAKYFASLLRRYDPISTPDVPPGVTGFDQAFRAARTADNDYFVLLAIDEADRSFSATVDVYLARSGARIASFAAFRTGNDRVRDSLMKLASQIADLLPARGTLLVRKFGQGLIDLGSFQGVKKNDALVIVTKGRGQLKSDGPGLSYSENDVVGDFRLTGLDEGVSEGTVTGRGYFDYVNIGDQVLYPVKPATAPRVTPTQRSPNILTRIFGIGG